MDFHQGCVSRPHRTTVSKLMLFNLFCQAKPETTVLIFATIALLISSLSNVLLPTFAGKVIDIVTAHPDTEEGRKEALQAVNQTILLIVAVVIVGYVVCVPCSYHTMLDQLM
jgi:ABC-type multidrug transport system fused ATPase/permease subunit